MARQPNRIVLNEEQLIALLNLVESADPNLSKRAQVIIECSKGLNNKEVSEVVGMYRTNVAHWRNAYLEDGIDGLISKHGGGASPKNPVEDFDTTLDKLLDDKSINWSAEALAQETGASLNMIYYALKKRGVSLQRKRQWIIPTQDEVVPKAVDIVGLYVSKEEQAMIVCCSSSTILSSKGELITRCKELSDDFEAFTGTVSLADAINTAAERAQNVLKQKSTPLSEFLTETVALFPSTPGYEYHLFICSPEDRPYRSDLVRNVYQVRPTDSAEWLGFVNQKVSELGDRSQLNSVSNLSNAIQGYLQKSTDMSSPLIWRKILDTEVRQDSVEVGETGNSGSDDFLQKLQDFLKSNLPSLGMDDSALRVGFVSFACTQDEIMVSLDEDPNDLLNVQTLPLDTVENCTATLTTLESEILKIRNSAGKHGIEMAAELLKKNSQWAMQGSRGRE